MALTAAIQLSATLCIDVAEQVDALAAFRVHELRAAIEDGASSWRRGQDVLGVRKDKESVFVPWRNRRTQFD